MERRRRRIRARRARVAHALLVLVMRAQQRGERLHLRDAAFRVVLRRRRGERLEMLLQPLVLPAQRRDLRIAYLARKRREQLLVLVGHVLDERAAQLGEAQPVLGPARGARRGERLGDQRVHHVVVSAQRIADLIHGCTIARRRARVLDVGQAKRPCAHAAAAMSKATAAACARLAASGCPSSAAAIPVTGTAMASTANRILLKDESQMIAPANARPSVACAMSGSDQSSSAKIASHAPRSAWMQTNPIHRRSFPESLSFASSSQASSAASASPPSRLPACAAGGAVVPVAAPSTDSPIMRRTTAAASGRRPPRQASQPTPRMRSAAAEAETRCTPRTTGSRVPNS